MQDIDIKSLIEAQYAHQNELNSVIDTEWHTRGRDWRLAIMLEAAECIEHTNWKWWTTYHVTPEIVDQRIRVEIADMWHFVLSMCIEEQLPTASLRSAVRIAYNNSNKSVLDRCKMIIQACTLPGDNDFMIALLVLELANTVGMPFTELHELHTAKYVLNKFRQDNGYKVGEYRKIWFDGREDNDHLQEVLEAYRDVTSDAIAMAELLPILPKALEAYIYDTLRVRYTYRGE